MIEILQWIKDNVGLLLSCITIIAGLGVWIVKWRKGFHDIIKAKIAKIAWTGNYDLLKEQEENRRRDTEKLFKGIQDIKKIVEKQSCALRHVLAKEVIDAKEKAVENRFIDDCDFIQVKEAYEDYSKGLNGNGEITKAFHIIEAIYERGKTKS